MKKVVLLLLAAALSANLYAQGVADHKNVLGISPFRLWNGLRFKYERVQKETLTLGGTATLYYGTFPGFQAAPAARYYFKKHAPEGLYVQGKLLAGVFQCSYTETVYSNSTYYSTVISEEDKKATFGNFGVGFAAGYQVLWGKGDRWSVDVNLGLKFVGATPSPEPDKENGVITVDNVNWYLLGPGSIIDGLVSVGYRF